MAEYIKIEDIPFKDLATCHGAANKLLVAFASDIASLPTVKIVRCKDCKHYSVEGGVTRFGYCNGVHEHDTDPDGYCHHGERKE